jgi:hypothetical protein
MSETRKRLTTVERADFIAEKTADAYSFDRYAPNAWRACCRMLARRGYNVLEIEAVMRSKWTRWAGDASDKDYGHITSKDLERWMDASVLPHEVRQLAKEHFGVTE